MAENILNKSKEIIKKLEDIMKCDICNAKYDYNIHRPLIVKCGHTFCKNCIYYSSKSKNKNHNSNSKIMKNFICPIDSINHPFFF